MPRVAFFAVLLSFAFAASPVKPVVDRARGEVRIPATLQLDAMSRPLGVKGHHAVVWKGGRSKYWALFASDVSDRDVRRALEAAGAKAGENLTPATWNERGNERSGEPGKRVEGTPIDVFVEWKGSPRVPLAALLTEKGAEAPHLDFRYGGNQRWREEFRSGCIVCLYSCPGGAIGNHARTIRDYVRDGVVYASLAERLPANGTRVTIVLKVRSNG